MRIKYVVATSLLLSLMACSAPQSAINTAVRQTLEAQTPVVQTVQQEVTRVVEVTRIVERVVTATPRPTPRPTNTPPAPEIGTRNNPYPVGEAALIRRGEIEFTLTVAEVLRGDDAYDRILRANRFNDPAPEGFEFVLAHVEVSYTGEDQGVLEIQKEQFAVITKGRAIRYIDTWTYSPCCIQPDLELSLFQGGTGDGWIALPVAVDDPNPLLVIGLRDDGSGGIFFSLTP